IMRRQNGNWAHWTNPQQSLSKAGDIIFFTDIAMVSTQDGWTAGGYIGSSALAHWDGKAWVLADNPATEWLQAIDMLSDREGWAVGDQGTIIRYAPGP
ncbi:MAG: hypothetical protein R3293_25620, partial [Candidatus Promineifilaceae bacterium]|nr:hypothetical protein [Candidatus Promineifilaceae bacterium]